MLLCLYPRGGNSLFVAISQCIHSFSIFFFSSILYALEFVDLIHFQASSKDLYNYFLCSFFLPFPSRVNPFLQYFQRTLKAWSAYHHLHLLSPQQTPPQTVSSFRMQPALYSSSWIMFLSLRRATSWRFCRNSAQTYVL